MAILEVIEKPVVFGGVHFARPNYLRIINVGFVVHPFGERLVLRPIAYQNQVFAWSLLQSGLNGCPAEIVRSFLVPRELVELRKENMQRHSHSADAERERADYNRRASQERSSSSPFAELSH